MIENNNKNNNRRESPNADLYAIEQIPVACRYNVYLNAPIERQSSYIHLFDLFRKATQNDVIYFHINCEGGNVSTGIQLLSAMEDCEATIVTVLDGGAYSMATFLFLAGDQYIVNKNSMMMFHNFSTGFFPSKGNEIKTYVDAYSKMFDRLMGENVYPFLNEDEIEMIGNGSDVWVTADEINERLETFVEYQQERIKEEQDKMTEESVSMAQQIIEEYEKENGGSKKNGRTSSRKKNSSKKSVSKRSGK